MKPLIAIVGPTGVGKSTLALKLARAYRGEIVSCDSRQVYRHMDIGTAKPTPEERASVPHHLVDIILPDAELSLAGYQEMAYRAIGDIHRRGKLPFLVGGTGQYFRAVVEGWAVPRVPPDNALRERLEAEAESRGAAALFAELTDVDPAAARKIDPRNVRRVIRALEVYRSTGVPFSQLQKKQSPPYRTLVVGLTLEREELYRRVDARVDRMLDAGLVGEVTGLIAMGYGPDLPAMSGIGYRQISAYLDGKLTLTEAVQQTRYETHRYIRQQYTWFRLKDERIHWFNIYIDNAAARINELVSEFIKESAN
jgi:tRNA dimethylallyltransferase